MSFSDPSLLSMWMEQTYRVGARLNALLKVKVSRSGPSVFRGSRRQPNSDKKILDVDPACMHGLESIDTFMKMWSVSCGTDRQSLSVESVCSELESEVS